MLLNVTAQKLDQQEIENLLEASNLVPAAKKSLKEILRDNDLDTSDTIGLLSNIARGGDTDAARLKAIDMALKLNGDLLEEQKPIPIINITINGSQQFSVNPILIPRQVIDVEEVCPT